MSVWPRVLILLLLACAHAHDWPAVPMMRSHIPGMPDVEPDFSDPADDIPKTRKESLAMLRKYIPSDDPPDNYNLPPKKPETQERIKPEEVTPKNYEKPQEPVEEANVNMFDNLELHLAVNDNQPARRMPKMPPLPNVPPPPPLISDSTGNFEDNSFMIKGRRRLKVRNLTQCIDLKPHKPFEPAMIVDIPWVAFYDFNLPSDEVTIHVFKVTYVPARVVTEYIDLYKNHTSDAVNWDQPKLLLKEIGPTDTYSKEHLLIPIDRRGLFHVLTRFEKPEGMRRSNVTVMLPTMLLKVEDPYLLIVYCEADRVILFAQEDYVPETKEEKEAEAATIGIKKKGGAITRDRALAQKLIAKDITDKAKRAKEKEARKYLPPNGEYGLSPSDKELPALDVKLG